MCLFLFLCLRLRLIGVNIRQLFLVFLQYFLSTFTHYTVKIGSPSSSPIINPSNPNHSIQAITIIIRIGVLFGVDCIEGFYLRILCFCGLGLFGGFWFGIWDFRCFLGFWVDFGGFGWCLWGCWFLLLIGGVFVRFRIVCFCRFRIVFGEFLGLVGFVF